MLAGALEMCTLVARSGPADAGAAAPAGVRCRTIGSGRPSVTISYRAGDAGVRGVAALTIGQLRTLHRIERKVRSHTLRFAFVPRSEDPTLPTFVVFDAASGPCPEIPGYGVLNGPCNLFFAPRKDGPTPLSFAPDCVGHKAAL